MSEEKNLLAFELQRFFTPGALAEKRKQLAQLENAPALGLFVARVPWFIQLPDQSQKTGGDSENMRQALSDIEAHLRELSKTYKEETIVQIDIDQERLPQLNEQPVRIWQQHLKHS